MLNCLTVVYCYKEEQSDKVIPKLQQDCFISFAMAF